MYINNSLMCPGFLENVRKGDSNLLNRFFWEISYCIIESWNRTSGNIVRYLHFRKIYVVCILVCFHLS